MNRRRLERWPATLNATATHDTKRGEDSRARLNVLSEMPDEWERRLERWIGVEHGAQGGGGRRRWRRTPPKRS